MRQEVKTKTQKVEQTTLKKGTTISKSDANETRGKSETNYTKEKEQRLPNPMPTRQEAKSETNHTKKREQRFPKSDANKKRGRVKQ